MGIKRPICYDCEYTKETKKLKCKFPKERGKKIGHCAGLEPYYPLWKEAADHINKNYKGLR